MSITTLKTLRLIIPGLMILFVIFTIQNEDLSDLSETLHGVDLSKDNFIFYVVPFVLGVIYYALQFRNLFFAKPLDIIQGNIRGRLVSEFDNDGCISHYSNSLKGNDKVIQVFYGFVDSNESLKEKSNNVRANGVILSSFADACVISIFAGVVYLLLLILHFSLYYVVLCIFSGLIFGTSYFLFLPNTTRIHLDYSDSQIDFIITNLREELRGALLKLIETDYAS